MEESDYTPGPWHVGPRFTVTADTPQAIDHGHFKGFSEPEYAGKYLIAESVVLAANANLIAAAPELLEGLEAIMGFADVALQRPDLVGGVEAVKNLRGPAFDDARAVIAKARGLTA